MYVKKILLTLMFTTLYLAPGAELVETQPEGNAQQPEEVEQLQVLSVNGVYHPRDVPELTKVFRYADDSGKLCLIYYVDNTDEYDGVFENLTNQYSDVVFVKIIMETRTPHKNTTHKIAFYKSGNYSTSFNFNNQEDIENLILSFKNNERDKFIFTNQEKEKEVQSVNGIYQALNASDLSSIFRYANKSEKLCLLYQVNNTNEYDEMFENLTSQHSNTVFIKFDSSTYLNKNGKTVPAGITPAMTFYKFGIFGKSFRFNKGEDIAEKIRIFEYMERDEFINTNQEKEKEVLSVNGVYHPQDDFELSSIMRHADNSRKLCLIYYVDNTNEYDEMFEKLTEKHTDVVFVKFINVTIITPEILFYKSGLYRGSFNFKKDDDIANLIQSFKDNEEDKYTDDDYSDEEEDEYTDDDYDDYTDEKVNIIYKPQNENELLDILSYADNEGKLCLMYHVDSTDEYDEMFELLKNEYSTTMFIKMDLSKYIDKNGNKLDEGTNHKIIFYKFGNFGKSFLFNKGDDIAKIIREYEHMERNEFINTNQEKENEVGVGKS